MNFTQSTYNNCFILINIYYFLYLSMFDSKNNNKKCIKYIMQVFIINKYITNLCLVTKKKKKSNNYSKSEFTDK